MESPTFLTIGEHSISLKKAIEYLNASGELSRVIQKIVRQYLLEQELDRLAGMEVNPLKVDQAMMEFRTKNRLFDQTLFEQWLQTQNTDYEGFRQQFVNVVKLEQLKTEIASPQAEEYFNNNKDTLEQVVLSRIIVSDRDKAEQLKTQILGDCSQFEPLAKEHSLTEDRLSKGMMGSMRMGQLPETVRTALTETHLGDIIGPVVWGQQHALLRLEERIPAVLEGQLKQELENQFFERWLAEKAKDMTIKLNTEG